MTIAHSALTGSDLHEPKGVATAVAGTVYAANGSGSGSWTDPNTLITSSVFTTGDVKFTLKTSEVGWVAMDDGTIGDATSGATTRANTDCEDLFTILWNNVSNTWAAVSSGRGVSAAADWAAHKTIALPKALGRALAAAGSGSGLTARAIGENLGVESHALTQAQLPNVSPTFTGIAGGVTVNSANTNIAVNSTLTHAFGAGGAPAIVGTVVTQLQSTGSFTPAGTISALGSGSTHPNMQPSLFLNCLIKL
jgi:microcystin-dependent protein